MPQYSLVTRILKNSLHVASMLATVSTNAIVITGKNKPDHQRQSRGEILTQANVTFFVSSQHPYCLERAAVMRNPRVGRRVKRLTHNLPALPPATQPVYVDLITAE